MDIVIAIVAGLVGVLVGGVINVLADDLPEQEWPHKPHYPDGSPRPPAAWLGIMAFLTGLRDSPNPAPLPDPDPDETPALDAVPEPPRSPRLGWRYPLVEIGAGLVFAAMALAFREEANLPFWFVYMAIMILITVIDVEHRLILFAVIVPSCVFALIVAAVAPESDREFKEYVIGGVMGFAMFFAMFLGGGAFSILMGRDEVAFGFGDVMLATLSGLMLGWRAFIFASLITVFAGAAGSILYLVGRMLMRKRYRWFTPLPYGPYIVIGTLMMLLFREEVQDFLRANTY